MRVNACMLTPPSQRASIFHRVHQSKRERMLPASLVLAEESTCFLSRCVALEGAGLCRAGGSSHSEGVGLEGCSEGGRRA
eukprot:scaffold59571_cov40-Phaeocystis_antarctica.AAC.1